MSDKLFDKQNDKFPPPRDYRITPRELQTWMEWHRLSQIDLAKLTGRSRQSVRSWLSGQFRTPTDLYGMLCAYGKPWVPQYKALAHSARDRAFSPDRRTPIHWPHNEPTGETPDAIDPITGQGIYYEDD